MVGAGGTVRCRRGDVKQCGSRDRFADAAFDETNWGGRRCSPAPRPSSSAHGERVPGGDHLIVLLRVLLMSADPDRKPLIWHDSEFRAVAPLSA